MGRMSRDPRYGVVSFRVGDEEMKLIIKTANDSGKTRCELARELVLQGIRDRAAEVTDDQSL